MRILFMGTPDFAVPCLQAINEAGHEVIGVITQPDRPKGRGQKKAPPPVKEEALRLGIEVFQPDKVKTPEFTAKIKEINPNCIVVVAFGQLLSAEILSIPQFGCINVHASLLPHYRGAAPIHWAVINGEHETGVTTMFMDEGMDTGDMILKKNIPIGPIDTVGVVHDKLAVAGSNLLIETLALVEAGTAPREKQDSSLVTYAPLLHKDDEIIRWYQRAGEIYNRVRGMNPWPGAYTIYGGKILKIWAAEVVPGEPEEEPGIVVEVLPKKGFVVAAGNGLILVKDVQLQGSKRMSAPDFMRGNPVKKGIVLG